MLEKGKISPTQIVFLMVPAIIGTGILSIPAVAEKYAVYDLWMTPLLGSLIGYFTVYLVWKLHQLYPDSTPIEYCENILGKFFGKFMGFIFVFFYIQNTGFIIRQYSDFITSNVMHETPLAAFSFTILLVSSIAVRGGIEVVARSSVICSGIYLLGSVVILFLIKDIDLGFMLPIL